MRATILFSALIVALSFACEGEDPAKNPPTARKSSANSSVSPVEPAAAKPQTRRERPLPAFSGWTLDGQRLSISTLIGKRLLLFFFDPDVKGANEAAKAVVSVNGLSGEHNFRVIGIAMDSRTEQIREFVDANQIEFSVIDDSSATISKRLGLRGPLAVLGVDAEGYMKFGFSRLPPDATDVERMLRESLRLPPTDGAQESLSSQRPEAPDFLADVLDEDVPFSLSAQRGKPVILMFFLHTCPHCHEVLHFMKEQLPKIPEDARPILVGVELTGRRGGVRSELSRQKLDFFKVVFDDDQKIRNAYGVHGGVPDIFPIDSAGRITARVQGWRHDEDPPLMRMRLAKLAGQPVPMLLRSKGYSGNEFCGVCHESQLDTWQFTQHSSAFGTLVRHGKDSDTECVSCHVVGYDQPGGFELSHPAKTLENVGCESCHGRGGPHLSPGFVDEGNYQPVCVTCHDTKHSLGFDYAAFLPRVSHAANLHLTQLTPEQRSEKLAALGRPGGELLPTSAAYVGSESCAGCHASEFATWQANPHARAHTTLTDKGADTQAECLACHTTGMGREGGFPESGDFAAHALATPDLAQVGCESCHGPGADHVAEGAMRRGTILSLGDKCDSCVILQICGSCHDDANDPGFEFEVLDKIEILRHGTIEPGTGKPIGTSASAKLREMSDHALSAHAFSWLDQRS